MLRNKFAITVGLVFVCTSLTGVPFSQAQQTEARFQNAPAIATATIETKPTTAEDVKLKLAVPFQETSSRRIQITPSQIALSQSSTLPSAPLVKKESLSALPLSKPVYSNSPLAVPARSNFQFASSPTPVNQTALPAATNGINYSFQRDGLPTLEQRRELRSTPIELRPYRPFHFYGNAVRRSGRK